MDLNKPILAIFAHPDDETFALGGAVALAVKAGTEVKVVSATRGEKGKLNLPEQIPENELGSLRAKELEKALNILGAHTPIVWDYGDGKLDQANPEEIVNKLIKIIEEFKPHTIVTFGPDGVSGHKDHVAIHNLATEAFRISSQNPEGPKALFWLARPKIVREAFYQHLSSRPRTQGHYHAELPEVPYQDSELIAVDIKPVLDAKVAAAQAHVSQNPARFTQRIATQSEEFWRYEYLYPVPTRLINK